MTRRIPLLILLAILTFLVILPMGTLLYATVVDEPPRPGAPAGTFTWENYRAVLAGANRSALYNTLTIGIGATCLAMFIGTGLAWIAARTNVPGKAFVQMAGVMPLFVSTLIGALSWSLLASPQQGYLNILLRDIGLPGFLNIYSLPGIIFVSGLYYAPYAFMLSYSAFTLLNPELEEAAYVHGGRFRNVLGGITFKLVAPSLLGAATLILVFSMENFPIPQILGTPENIQTLPSQIYRLMATAPSLPNQASATGAVLLLITAVMVFLQRRVLAARQYVTVTGKGFKPNPQDLGRWRWPAFAFALAYVVVAIVLPIFALVQGAFRSNPYTADVAAMFSPENFATDTMREVLGSEALQTGLRNSIMVGAGAAVVGGLFYLMLGYYVHRTKGIGRQTLTYIAMWPAAIPALIIGLGFLWGWSDFHFIYGTLAILILAYVANLLPQGFQGMSSSLIQVHRDLEESAEVCGASRVRTVREILLPLIRTGVVSTMLLIFILSMREISVAMFLFTSDTQLLSISIYNSWEGGRLPPVAAMSLVYVVFLLVLTFVARRWFGMRDPGGR
ncbi:iron ABC transporter permease [Streptomyces sp. NBRC 109706]|uniref:ABC transporter permease n=1 Tax=Streptomyces sp. NBRC 109706 TaxID=1550035 RepID=UPI0007862990|nr:iron ABC transporter permease [Streptomyces sp. NBRC 109706]